MVLLLTAPSLHRATIDAEPRSWLVPDLDLGDLHFKGERGNVRVWVMVD